MASPDSGPHGCVIGIDPETGIATDGLGNRVPEADQPPDREME